MDIDSKITVDKALNAMKKIPYVVIKKEKKGKEKNYKF